MTRPQSKSVRLLPWFIVAFGFLALALSFSGRATLSLVMPVWSQELGWLRGLAFVLLMNVGASYERLVVFAIFFGAVDYATVPVTASLVARHLGLSVMGLAMGIISAGHAIGAAAGAFLGGYLFDLTLRYEWLWLSSVALTVGAGLIVFLLRDKPEAVAVEA